ncbi:MAG: hypothetical protein ABFS56_01940 [Pseudomonadota bacterium]
MPSAAKVSIGAADLSHTNKVPIPAPISTTKMLTSTPDTTNLSAECSRQWWFTNYPPSNDEAISHSQYNID